ncbi:hypothetical protein Ciccas_005671 [Cichlidogyrus casuarinus]|uniref:EF-hand domain-containing protein n=1 Tax=Cichlidogyrus casuarinus TaxID=1844966 RepID=A0ABD2Q7Z7_9PLAT
MIHDFSLVDEGSISLLELRYLDLVKPKNQLDFELFQRLIPELFPAELKRGLFLAFDENNDGLIDFRELVFGISASCRVPTAELPKCRLPLFSSLSSCINLTDEGCVLRTDLESLTEEINFFVLSRPIWQFITGCYRPEGPPSSIQRFVLEMPDKKPVIELHPVYFTFYMHSYLVKSQVTRKNGPAGDIKVSRGAILSRLTAIKVPSPLNPSEQLGYDQDLPESLAEDDQPEGFDHSSSSDDSKIQPQRSGSVNGIHDASLDTVSLTSNTSLPVFTSKQPPPIGTSSLAPSSSYRVPSNSNPNDPRKP